MRRLPFKMYGRSVQRWQRILLPKDVENVQGSRKIDVGSKYADACQKTMVYLFLASVVMGFCYLFCLRYGVFGSKIDWISQHSVLPEYFRQQFYDTGKLIPEFAANIGGGQNIYNLSYYGLYNPALLPSYLLPFVKMSDYMITVQLLGLTASTLLMYGWLKKRGFSEKICVGMAILFLLSGPMIFHSYNQIMFVNYMPFLLMGLRGVDRYFERQRGILLTAGIFLMIMTSFYFSIGGMLALALYGIHRYLMICDEERVNIRAKAFFMEGLKFSFCFVTAVMMSGILLAPTALALSGRKGGESFGAAVSFLELIIPKVSMTRICYSPYGIGMTTLGVTALIAMALGAKRYERVLALSCITILTVPLYPYLLNGGLYVRDKVMIPFLPLLCYILAYYLEEMEHMKSEKIENRRNHIRRSFMQFLPYVLTIGIICFSRRQKDIEKYWKLLLLDSILMSVCFFIFNRRQRKSMILLAPAVLMLVVFDFECHTQADRMLNQGFYEDMTDTRLGEVIRKAAKEENGFYRTEQLGNDDENAANLNRIWNMGQYSSSIYSSSYHGRYREFREKIFQLEEPFRNCLMQSAARNPVYQRFMGVKYLVSKKDIPGYEVIEAGENDTQWKIYENPHVSPIAYGTDNVISAEEYQKLEFPYNQLVLLQHAVVSEEVRLASVKTENYEVNLEKELAKQAAPVSLSLPESIDSDTNTTFQMKLPAAKLKNEGEKVLFLRFRIENEKPSKDVAVWVEGIRNKLTARSHFYYNGNTEFTYGVPLLEGQESVEMIFGKGKYEILDAEAFIGILPEREDTLYQSVFQVNREKTKGNRIEGIIDAERAGYFITTIPYDENFDIFVDGEKVTGKEVNMAFLGFQTGAGKHEVRMVYHAPGVKAGKFMTIVGIVLFLGMGCYGKGQSRDKTPSTPLV